MLFKNRFDAGEQLAGKLKNYKDSIILAVPRGGLEIALPIAKKINGAVEIIVARKIATPQDPEAGIGAVMADGTAVYNELYVEQLGLLEEDLKIMEKEATDEAARRDRIYRTGKKVPLKGKVVILVDDGLATGYTMLAAIKSVKKSKPEKIIVSVPVAAHNSYETVKRECDEIFCLHVSESWAFAVGSFYEEFPQLEDEQVIKLLRKANEK
ncbi:MAG: phosphoribosyltransferase [Candidatus Aenigmarchaeota archaeon]|nr:phosphoribosyltransferase [Candidatus Aenigmarchaeota archaeon]